MNYQIYRIGHHVYARKSDVSFSSSAGIAHITRMFGKVWTLPGC